MPGSPERPRVSVAMLAYNHERFIRQAIESVLMQQTSFPIELVIGEDGSQDGTRAIVEEFAASHPAIVRAHHRTPNLGAHRNLRATLESCRGEYIAFLEGDDYWTAADKLQRQVELLDRHPGHALCAHRFMHVYEDRPATEAFPSPVEKETGTLEDILRRNYVHTCTVLYRASALDGFPSWLAGLYQNDWPLWLCLAERGTIGFIDEIMATYRMHASGMWIGAATATRVRTIRQVIDAMHTHLGNRHPGIRRASLFDLDLDAARLYNREGRQRDAARHLFRALMRRPAAFATSTAARARIRELIQASAARRAYAGLLQRLARGRIWLGAARRRLLRQQPRRQGP